MASAQLMEEELQRSAMDSEVAMDVDNQESQDLAPQVSLDSQGEPFPEDEVEAVNGDEDRGVIVNSVESEAGEEDEDEDEDEYDEEGEDQDDEDGQEDDNGEDVEEQDSEDDEGEHDGQSSEDDFEEEDAEGEEDGDGSAKPLDAGRKTLKMEENEADVDDEAEGVGAVKIRPGETDDEDDSSQSELSEGQSDEDSEDDTAWEEAAGNGDGDDDEDEDENAQPNTCMFCKEDEEHDPSDDFEPYLACSGCGENSHQQCARDNDALDDKNPADDWRCPECAPTGREPDAADDDASSPVEIESPSSARGATAPKIARDLLPSQRGTVKPDSHSVFNNLVLDDDPMDGSRVLRKRKTSSAEADDNVISLRKRRKNTADEASHDEGNGADESVRTHSARSLRLKTSDKDSGTIEKKTRSSLVLRLKASASVLRKISERPPKAPKRRGGRTTGGPRGGRRTTRTVAQPALTAPFASSTFYQPFFFDKEMDELKGKPYGGILNETEADTTRTFPQPEDRKRFDEAKQKAEEEWRQRILKMQAVAYVPVKKQKKSTGPASQIECIDFGGWEIDTWYAAPYPEEYSRNRVLYICEFCLKYMNSDYVAWRHKLKCPAKHPPGDEIYRHRSVSVFEVDGRKNPVYCQNLCLLAKLFLGSKTLYYDVEPFLFYVLCEYNEYGYHFVGYFSKEKRASSQNNVSCILTLPIHQRKGYGNLLIDFSYLLTRVEKKTGSPEKPLSDMGLVSYRNYWRLVICQYLVKQVSGDKSVKKGLSVKQMSDDTGLTPDDVISALEGLRCLVRDPLTHHYAFRVDLDYCKDYLGKWETKKYVKLDERYLTWTPYVMGRSNATNFELGPALNAIAPREEDEETKPSDAAVADLPNSESTVVFAVPAVTNINGNGVNEDVKMDDVVDPPVLESTEPNEDGQKGAGEGEKSPPAAEGSKENTKASTTPKATAQTPTSGDSSSPAAANGNLQDNWMDAYNGIPAARFQVFPAISTRRIDRPRTVIRAPISTPVTVPRPKPKPRRSTGGGGGRRVSAPKPKSSTTRVRKSGGTGRGPGRWPKGTKKSDYGNADSGPGLPPAWIAERNRLAAVAEAARREELAGRAAAGAASSAGAAPGASGKDDTTKDTVQVQTPTSKGLKVGEGSVGVKSADKRNGVNGP